MLALAMARKEEQFVKALRVCLVVRFDVTLETLPVCSRARRIGRVCLGWE